MAHPAACHTPRMEPAERMALGMVDAERKRRQNVAGAEVLEIDGLVLAFSNLPDPQLNSVMIIATKPTRLPRWKRPSASSFDG